MASLLASSVSIVPRTVSPKSVTKRGAKKSTVVCSAHSHNDDKKMVTLGQKAVATFAAAAMMFSPPAFAADKAALQAKGRVFAEASADVSITHSKHGGGGGKLGKLIHILLVSFWGFFETLFHILTLLLFPPPVLRPNTTHNRSFARRPPATSRARSARPPRWGCTSRKHTFFPQKKTLQNFAKTFAKNFIAVWLTHSFETACFNP
jgi:hypothetical protein